MHLLSTDTGKSNHPTERTSVTTNSWSQSSTPLGNPLRPPSTFHIHLSSQFPILPPQPTSFLTLCFLHFRENIKDISENFLNSQSSCFHLNLLLFLSFTSEKGVPSPVQVLWIPDPSACSQICQFNHAVSFFFTSSPSFLLLWG